MKMASRPKRRTGSWRPGEGRCAYVIGGSRGIGLAIAERLAAGGADLALVARDPETLEQARRRVLACSRSTDRRVVVHALDITDRTAVAEAMRVLVAELGPPSLLVNCAGRARPQRFEDLDAEQLHQTMDLNLHGTIHVIASLLPAMKPAGGWIVNVASLAGLIGVYGYTDYCASKFAVIGFSEALRQELWPSGIGVTVLCPPDTDTPGFARENETKPEETWAVSGGVRPLQAGAVADALLDGLARGRLLVIPGLDGKLAYLAKRLVPGLVEWWSRRAIAKVQRPSRGAAGA
jgi:3-dehydrosphinganine reductase